MKHNINLCSGSLTLDESTSLADIQQAEPMFFKTPFGKRETYTMYRGQLIVRYTVSRPRMFNPAESFRKTTIHLFDKESGTHCVSSDTTVKDIRHAKRIIDRIITKGSYQYGDNETIVS